MESHEASLGPSMLRHDAIDLSASFVTDGRRTVIERHRRSICLKPTLGLARLPPAESERWLTGPPVWQQGVGADLGELYLAEGTDYRVEVGLAQRKANAAKRVTA